MNQQKFPLGILFFHFFLQTQLKMEPQQVIKDFLLSPEGKELFFQILQENLTVRLETETQYHCEGSFFDLKILFDQKVVCSQSVHIPQ